MYYGMKLRPNAHTQVLIDISMSDLTSPKSSAVAASEVKSLLVHFWAAPVIGRNYCNPHTICSIRNMEWSSQSIVHQGHLDVKVVERHPLSVRYMVDSHVGVGDIGREIHGIIAVGVVVNEEQSH